MSWNGLAWTDDADAIVQRLWSAGYNTTCIATALGRSRNSILGRMRVLREAGRLVEPRYTVLRKARKLRPQLSLPLEGVQPDGQRA